MLKGTFNKQYRSSNSGNPVFVYTVHGSEKELEAFEEAQGEFARQDDDGNNLYFTTRYANKNCKLIITSKGKVVVDNSEFDQMNSLIEQAGNSPLAMAMANIAAAKLLNAETAQAPAQVATPAEPVDTSASPEDMDI